MVGNVYLGQTDGISAKNRDKVLFKQVDATNRQRTLFWGLQIYCVKPCNLKIQD